MAEYLIQDTTLDAIADAINAKTGGSSAMTPADMVTEIGTISGGGVTITKQQYTQAEDWLTTQSGGNSTNFYNTYADSEYAGMQYIIVTNNTAAGKYANSMYIVKMLSRNTTTCLRGATNAMTYVSPNADYFITAGSIITVYKIPEEAFN